MKIIENLIDEIRDKRDSGSLPSFIPEEFKKDWLPEGNFNYIGNLNLFR